MRRLLLLALAWSLLGCGPSKSLDPDLAKFVAAKRKDTEQIASELTNTAPSLVWMFFNKVEADDRKGATALYARMDDSLWLDRGPPRPPADLAQEVRRFLNWDGSLAEALRSELWLPITETYNACRVFHDWDIKWLRRVSSDILESIPTNSVYCGGTDFGWCGVSVFAMSQHASPRLCVISQRLLRREHYFDYLRRTNDKLQIPTPTELEHALEASSKKLVARPDLRQRDPTDFDSLEWTILRALMAKNLTLAFYYQGLPLRGMYPHLEPHGLIFKINREPVVRLNEGTLEADRKYWRRYFSELLGEWLGEETSVKQICDFSQKIYGSHDLIGFNGAADYVRARATRKEVSEFRASIARVYLWRAQNAKSAEEKSAMLGAAACASRQAFALCPLSHEALYVFVDSLLAAEPKDIDGALLVCETFLHLVPEDPPAREMVSRIQHFKQQGTNRSEK